MKKDRAFFGSVPSGGRLGVVIPDGGWLDIRQ